MAPEKSPEREMLTSRDDDDDSGPENLSLSPVKPRKLALTEDESDDERRCSMYEMTLTVLTCVLYMLVGPMLIMSNKYLMTTGQFRFPILLTAFHQSSSSICCTVLIRCCRLVPLKHDVTWTLWWKNIFVVGATTTAALCTGTSSYLYLTVAFIEILKGFTPVVTMMVQSLFGEPLPSCRISAAVLMISLGTAISSYGELNLSLTGLVLMLVSVYCEATRLMLTQRLLKHMNFHVLVCAGPRHTHATRTPHARHTTAFGKDRILHTTSSHHLITPPHHATSSLAHLRLLTCRRACTTCLPRPPSALGSSPACSSCHTSRGTASWRACRTPGISSPSTCCLASSSTSSRSL